MQPLDAVAPMQRADQHCKSDDGARSAQPIGNVILQQSRRRAGMRFFDVESRAHETVVFRRGVNGAGRQDQGRPEAPALPNSSAYPYCGPDRTAVNSRSANPASLPPLAGSGDAPDSTSADYAGRPATVSYRWGSAISRRYRASCISSFSSRCQRSRSTRIGVPGPLRSSIADSTNCASSSCT